MYTVKGLLETVQMYRTDQLTVHYVYKPQSSTKSGGVHIDTSSPRTNLVSLTGCAIQ